MKSHPTIRLFVIAFVLCCLPLTLLAQGTITDGGTNFDINNFTSSSGMSADFEVPTGTDHLFATWWWYRIQGDQQETVFPPPDAQNYVGNTATLTWNDVDGRGFGAQLVLTLMGSNGGNSGILLEELTISNPAGVPSLEITLFKYADFDVDASAGGDSATLANANNHIQIMDTNLADFFMPDATSFGVDGFPLIRDVLNDALTNDFTNTGLPFGPGDFTGVLQTSTTVPSGAAHGKSLADVIISAQLAINSDLLPVELSSFDVILEDDTAVLNWQTASETDNAGFEVQREIAEDVFETLAWVDGHGTTTEPQAYTFRIEGLDYGLHHFRLKQIDFDGAFEYSEVVEATRELVEGYALGEFYPNPFNPQGQFTLMVARDQQVQIGVYNVMGQLIDVLHNGLLTGQESYTFTFDAGSDLPSGTYLIRVQGASFTSTQKIMLVK